MFPLSRHQQLFTAGIVFRKSPLSWKEEKEHFRPVYDNIFAEIISSSGIEGATTE